MSAISSVKVARGARLLLFENADGTVPANGYEAGINGPTTVFFPPVTLIGSFALSPGSVLDDKLVFKHSNPYIRNTLGFSEGRYDCNDIGDYGSFSGFTIEQGYEVVYYNQCLSEDMISV